MGKAVKLITLLFATTAISSVACAQSSPGFVGISTNPNAPALSAAALNSAFENKTDLNITPTGATVARTAAAKLSDILTSYDFGAYCNGSSHTLSSLGYTSLGAAQIYYPAATALTNEADWAAIQQQLNTQSSVYLPNGTCMLQGHLTITKNNQTIYGTRGASILETESASDDIVQVGTSSTAGIDDITFQSVTFWSSVTKTGGAAIKAISVLGRFHARDIEIGNNDLFNSYGNQLWDGIRADSANLSTSTGTFGDVWISGDIVVQNDAEAMANGSTWAHQGGYVTHCTRGFHAEGNVGGLSLTNTVNQGQCTYGAYFDTSVNTTANREFYADQSVAFDTNTNTGIYIASGGLSLMHLNGTWVAGNSYGINIVPPAAAGSEWIMNDMHVHDNTTVGVAVGDGWGAITGGVFTGNGTGASTSPNSAIYDTTGLGLVITGAYFAQNGPGFISDRDICFCGSGSYIADNWTLTGNTFWNTGAGVGGQITYTTKTPTYPNRVVRANSGLSDNPTYVASSGGTMTGALTAQGGITLNGNTSSPSPLLTITNSATGVSTPNKFIRVGSTGYLEFLNSAYTSTVAFITDTGAATFAQLVTMLGTQFTSIAYASLPTCNSGNTGITQYVNNLTSPTFMGTASGGGTVGGLVTCNGTNWITP